MPKDANEWREDLAREVATAYVVDDQIAAVAIAGSVARGLADRYSDIEIHVFWREVPTDQQRVAAAERAGGRIDVRWSEPPSYEEYLEAIEKSGGKVGLLWPRENEEWSETYYVKDVYIDVSGFLVSQVEEYLDELTREIVGGPSSFPNGSTGASSSVPWNDAAELEADLSQMLISAIETAIPLHGEALLEQWKERASRYPASLARSMVTRSLAVEKDWWACDQLAERGERALLYELFAIMERKVVRILLGLNRIYLPDNRLKWADVLIRRMKLRPPGLPERLTQVFREGGMAGVDEMQQILEDVWDLVDQEMPDIDPARRSRWFRHRRVTWEEAPE